MLGGVLGHYMQGGDILKGGLLFSVYGILNTFLVLLCLHVYVSGSPDWEHSTNVVGWVMKVHCLGSNQIMQVIVLHPKGATYKQVVLQHSLISTITKIS